jgi:peptide/nickel transport system permease protein
VARPDTVDTALVAHVPVLAGDIVEPDVVGAEEVRAAPSVRSAGLLVRAVLALVAGVALIVVGTMLLADVTAVPRVLCVLAGLGCLHVTLGSIGRYAAGRTALLVVTAAFADLLPLKPYDDVQAGLLEPSLARPDILSAHPLGTDRQGFDLLASVIYGARVSLLVGLGAVALGMVIGSAIGMAAGHYRGKVDTGVGLFADAMLAFPPLILLLGMVSVLDPSALNVMLALALLSIPTYIRLARANTMVFAQRDFVLGASIVAEAGLSFLGLGIQRPTPTWGNMINGGQASFQRDPHVVFVPGICLFMTVFSFNRIGEKARKAWDPRGARL